MERYDTYVLFVVLGLASFAGGQIVSDPIAALLLNLSGGACAGHVLGGLITFVGSDPIR
jgi:hypothetical protein